MNRRTTYTESRCEECGKLLNIVEDGSAENMEFCDDHTDPRARFERYWERHGTYIREAEGHEG